MVLRRYRKTCSRAKKGIPTRKPLATAPSARSTPKGIPQTLATVIEVPIPTQIQITPTSIPAITQIALQSQDPLCQGWSNLVSFLVGSLPGSFRGYPLPCLLERTFIRLKLLLVLFLLFPKPLLL